MTGLIASLLLSLWCAELTTSQLISCNKPDHVRLFNASGAFTKERAGRVEICDCGSSNSGCQWKTITVPTGSVAWGWKNAQVACRELYPEDYGVMNPILQDTLPDTIRASSSQSVFDYTIDCDGTEASVANCSMTPSSVTSHARDAYIWCRSMEPNGEDVRLIGSTVSNAVGAVEVYDWNTGWHTICTDIWDSSDADVACMQLGYESGTRTSFDSRDFAGQSYGNLSTDNIICDGSDAILYECFSQRMESNCTESNLRGGVTCISSGLPEGSVRINPPSYVTLTGGETRLVEILYDGRWGIICDIGWDLFDGEVVCQSLGEGAPYIAEYPAFYRYTGQARAIWLSALDCNGSEDNLTLCSRYYPVGYAPSCTVEDPAVLECAETGPSAGEVVAITLAAVVASIIIVPFAFLCCKKTVEFTKRFKSSSTTRRARNLSEQDHELPEQGRSSPPAPSQDTDLKKEAPPSCFDAAPLVTAGPIATPDPPQRTAHEQLGDPESSSPSNPISTSHLPHLLIANTELLPPQTSDAEASASHPQAASDAVEVHNNSDVISTDPMPTDINIPISTLQQALGDGEPPP